MLDATVEESARRAGIQGAVSKIAVHHIVPGIRALLRGEEFHQLSDRP